MERLQRILSARGIASRRVAEELIVAGRVSVNGEPVTALGAKADPENDVIRVDGKIVRPQQRRYVMLNKPRGYITTTNDERNRRTVMDLVKTRERLYPIGRLDRETEGLLLLTNDGELANRVMHPRFGLEKEYHILTPERPDARVIERVRKGIDIEGKKVVPNEFRVLRETREGILLTISLHEGMYHVVRRMMDYSAIPVDKLTRVRVGPLSIAGLPIGFWRDLRPGEEQTLFEAVHMDLDEDAATVRRDREIGWEREWSQQRQDELSPLPFPPRKPHQDADQQRPRNDQRSGDRRDNRSRSDAGPNDRRQFQPREGGQPGERRQFQPREGGQPGERRPIQPREGGQPGERRQFQPRDGQEPRRGPRQFDPKRDSWKSGESAGTTPERNDRNRPQRRPERPNRDFNPRDRDDKTPVRTFDHTGRPVKQRDQETTPGRQDSQKPEQPRESGNSRRDRGNQRRNDRRSGPQPPNRRDESRGVPPRHDRSKPRSPQGDRDRRPSRGGEVDRRPDRSE